MSGSLAVPNNPAVVRQGRSGNSGNYDGKPLPAPHGRGTSLDGVVVVDFPVRPALEHLVQGHATFQAGEGSPQAEVKPIAEAEMMPDVPMDVEAVGIDETAL